jgi:benzoyl-CoA reductase/2-hydroxyglutaryl-CoA dehydratase subunit BcrC/BadD/HgdB
VEIRLDIPHRLDVIDAHKGRGGSVAAVLPIHYPRALLRAFDVLPVEVWGPPGVDAGPGAAHLQAYLCAIVHHALSFLLAGGLDVADVLVVPHACDSLQGLGSILTDFVVPRQPVIPIYLPRGRRESDVDFLVSEFRSVYRQLEEITARSPSDEDLWASIRREEQADEFLSQLYQRRRALPLLDRDFYRLVRSREYLPAETFVELAQDMLAHAAALPQAGARAPVVLSGIVPEPMSLLDALSEMGGAVVADDLACCGRRLYAPGDSEEPYRRMAQGIIHAPPDPTRGNPIQERLEHLLGLVETTGARGVIFYDVKFCEPELFDIPDLGKALRAAGVPSLAIETDLGQSQQVLTRLQAFVEMIR